MNSKVANSPGFCIYPWIHIYAGQTGEIRMCCYQDASGRPPLGHAQSDSLTETWNGIKMKDARRKLLQGIPLPECSFCRLMERAGVYSPRRMANEVWADEAWKAESTAHGGGIEHEIVYLDIRFSNLCNFRCRMCDQNGSSGWFEDAKALGRHCVSPVVDHWSDNPVFWKEVSNSLVPGLREIYFGGGEPVLHDGHYRMLDLLRQRSRTDVRLSYTTNLSVMPERLLNQWESFDEVTLQVSIDGVGMVGPYIRKGFQWEKWIENAEKVRKYIRSFSTAISIYNIFHFPVLYKELRQLFDKTVFDIELVAEPPFLSIQVLDQESKRDVRTAHEAFWETLPRNSSIRQAVEGWFRFMDQEDRSTLSSDFYHFTSQLDTLRGESFSETVPELAAWYARLMQTEDFGATGKEAVKP